MFNSAPMHILLVSKEEADKREDQQLKNIINVIAKKAWTRAGACHAHCNTLAVFRNFHLNSYQCEGHFQVDTLKIFKQKLLYKVAYGEIDVSPQTPFYFIIDNPSN